MERYLRQGVALGAATASAFLLLLRLEHLFAQQRPDLLANAPELGRPPHVLPRLLELGRDLDHVLDATRARRHDRDALAEHHRLVDAVRDEKDRLARILPDP